MCGDFIRHPTESAQRSLARRFGLPYSDKMQDWEYEVADALRFHEFLDIYGADGVGDDERFSLMEILVQCVEDMGASDKVWSLIEPLLVKNYSLHLTTIHYWSMLDEEDPANRFNVSERMRGVLSSIDGNCVG